MFIASDTREDPAVIPHVLESRTRDRVLQVISERGPIAAGALAEGLGLTAAAVRRHLDNLVELGLIESREAAVGHRGRGRPARAYVVSEAGHQALESDYDHLATEALRFLADEAGDDAVTRFVQRRIKALEERYAAELAEAGQDPQARTAALVQRPHPRRLRRLGPPRGRTRQREPAHRHTAVPGTLSRAARGPGVPPVL